MLSIPTDSFNINAVFHSMLREESQVLTSQSAELRARASEALMTCGALRARSLRLGGRITDLVGSVANRVPHSPAKRVRPERCPTTAPSATTPRTAAPSEQTLRRCDAIRRRLQHTWRVIEKSGASMSTTRTHVDQTVDRIFICRQACGTQLTGLLYETLIAR